MKWSSIVFAILFLAVAWYHMLAMISVSESGIKPGAPNDFYQVWNSSRAVLHNVSPYSPQIGLQNQIGTYGTTAEAIGSGNKQLIAYPLQAIFPFLPLGVLTFPIADRVFFCLLAVLIIFSIGWLRGIRDARTVVYALLALGSYPAAVGLEMRQPTLFFFGMTVGSLSLFRSRRLAGAGLVGALAAGKPQIAAGVLLPMVISTLADWRQRRRFVVSFLTVASLLFAIATLLRPEWIPEWLQALHSYTRFVHPSLAVVWFGRKTGLALSVVLICGLTALLWMYRKRDLMFQVAVSVSVFCLVIQGEDYNMVLLLIPVIWIVDNCNRINPLGWSIMKVALWGSLLAAPASILLLRARLLSPKIAWEIPDAMIPPLLASTVALMIVEAFRGPQPSAQEAATLPQHAS